MLLWVMTWGMSVFLRVLHPPSPGFMVSSSEVWRGSFYESCVGTLFPVLPCYCVEDSWRLAIRIRPLLNASRSPRHVCAFVHHQQFFSPIFSCSHSEAELVARFGWVSIGTRGTFNVSHRRSVAHTTLGLFSAHPSISVGSGGLL